jgi:hypothetical protein
LDEFIAAHLRDVGAPGMTLALATRAGLLRASTYGFTDRKAGAKVQPNTLFEIGSISKSFVALSLMQMREEGKFDPSQPITTYLPWLKIDSKYAPITGHHLISRCGRGLRRASTSLIRTLAMTCWAACWKLLIDRRWPQCCAAACLIHWA